ncbi:hypothetical protein CONPUDRAFT_161849 [Coniophora puteana RWD-64-598 SS2]|uniref:MYND-type domain-containing protein n=1 Tax=Coniophora puteana (strain RWD-64-598) TaxID=741705 RepID=A0A5M3N7K5_CONPW|nr:uncharacterized protein CONPUDRAFT_161849 [Coniophora puteana RWD-64-598 SS2]EIW87268.1 hypothetical protein CONPUDRAFT_161849 [Coniophora puteana RWD-64-598 SS2]
MSDQTPEEIYAASRLIAAELFASGLLPEAEERSKKPDLASLLDNEKSAWANKNHALGFPVADVRTDLVKWMRGWDKGVERACSSATDVVTYTSAFRFPFYVSRTPGPTEYEFLRVGKLRAQDEHRRVMLGLGELYGELEKERCSIRDWFMLVSAEKRRKALARAFENTCWCTVLGQDSRVLCPEINSTTLLKRRGLELFDFCDRYKDNMSSFFGEDDPTQTNMLYSDWWRSARRPEDSHVGRNHYENYRYLYQLYTYFRLEFLDKFVYYTLKVVLMGFVENMSNSDSFVPRLIWMAGRQGVQNLLAVRREMRSRAGRRCEHCDRCPEDFGESIKFLICGACKRHLNFEYPYCSKECQMSDWPQHKVHCGKEKVSKGRDEGQPEYTLSLGALLQLEYQLQRPEFDYFIFQVDAPQGWPVVFLHDAEKRATFREKRAMVATDSDRAGLDVLAKCLVDALKADTAESGITRDNVIQQLCEEYEVDVKSRLEALEAELAMVGDEDRYSGMVVIGGRRTGSL